jgi:hypothetical protein
MLRLSYVSFKREAAWLLVVGLGIPLIGVLAAIVVPALARWLGWR